MRAKTRRKIKVYTAFFGIPAVAAVLLLCGHKTASFILFNLWFVPFVVIIANWPRIKAHVLNMWDEMDRMMEEKGLTRQEFLDMKKAETENLFNLREETGFGFSKCSKALKEADGDYNKALESLRKKSHRNIQTNVKVDKTEHEE